MLGSTILNTIKTKKPVLVFFEDEKALYNFSNSSYTDLFKDKIRIVTEKTDQRDFYITKATNPEMVTFFTAPFGRGTDFVILEPNVKAMGILVIQAFFS